MQNRQTWLVLLLAFSSLNVWAGTRKVERRSCGKEVASAQAGVKTTHMRDLALPATGPMDFTVNARGRLLLAHATDARTIAVTAPFESDRVLFPVEAAEGACFTGARWCGSSLPTLATADDQGRAIDFAARLPARMHQAQPVRTTLDTGNGRHQYAIGLGVMGRVRIVPVGSSDSRELPVAGAVIGLSSHVLPTGRTLLAVATTAQMQVFDLRSESDQPFYSTPLSGATDLLSWVEDDRGEVALVYVDGGSVVVKTPLNPNSTPITAPIGHARALETLRAPAGSVWVLVDRGGSVAPELFTLANERLTSVEGLGNLRGPVTLVPGESPAIAFTLDFAPGLVYLKSLANIEETQPLFGVASGEKLVSLKGARVSPRRSALAIGTDRRVRVYKVEPAR